MMCYCGANRDILIDYKENGLYFISLAWLLSIFGNPETKQLTRLKQIRDVFTKKIFQPPFC